MEEKTVVLNQQLVREPAVPARSLLRSVLLSMLLVSFVCSAGIFTARSMGSFELTESMSMTLCGIGATVCFTALPLLAALYRRKQQIAVIAASVTVYSLVVLAGVIS